MAAVSMIKQEFSCFDVLLRVQSGRLPISDACADRLQSVASCCKTAARTGAQTSSPNLCCKKSSTSPAQRSGKASQMLCGAPS